MVTIFADIVEVLCDFNQLERVELGVKGVSYIVLTTGTNTLLNESATQLPTKLL